MAENYIECLKNRLFILFILCGGVNTAFCRKCTMVKDLKNEQKMNRLKAGLFLLFLYGGVNDKNRGP